MIKELFKLAEKHSFAIIHGTQKITYLNLESQVIFYMNQLSEAGVSEGDKVALELEDKLEREEQRMMERKRRNSIEFY